MVERDFKPSSCRVGITYSLEKILKESLKNDDFNKFKELEDLVKGKIE